MSEPTSQPKRARAMVFRFEVTGYGWHGGRGATNGVRLVNG